MPDSVDTPEYGRFMKVESVPYWTVQRPEPVNPDRKVQLIVALLGELASTTCPVRRLLVVSVHGKVTHLTN